MNRTSTPTARFLSACVAITLLAAPLAAADSGSVAAPASDTSTRESGSVPDRTPGDMPTQTLFNFLAAYFSSAKAADVNGDGAINEKDLFQFLNAYLKGHA